MTRDELTDDIYDALSNAQDMDTSLTDYAKAVVRNVPLVGDAPELLRALADIVGNQLGASGYFSCLRDDYQGKRTEEILLLLLRHGVVVKAHQRAWRTPIPPELEPAMCAAGGQTYAEFMAEYEARKSAPRRDTRPLPDAETTESHAKEGAA